MIKTGVKLQIISPNPQHKSAPLVRTHRSLAAALNDFSVLLFVLPALEVLAELKRTMYSAFCSSSSDWRFTQCP